MFARQRVGRLIRDVERPPGLRPEGNLTTNEPSGGAGRSEQISPREREVLAEMCRGHSNAEIAERLHISHETVKSHVSALYRKLDVSTRAACVAAAIQRRLL